MKLPDYCRTVSPGQSVSDGGLIVITSRIGTTSYFRGSPGGMPLEENATRDDGLPLQLKYRDGRYKETALHLLHSPFTEDQRFGGENVCQPKIELGKRGGNVGHFQELRQEFQSNPYNTDTLLVLPKSSMISFDGTYGDMVFFHNPHTYKWISGGFSGIEDCVHVPTGTETAKVLEEVVPQLLKRHLTVDDADREYFEARTLSTWLSGLPERFPEVAHGQRIK